MKVCAHWNELCVFFAEIIDKHMRTHGWGYFPGITQSKAHKFILTRQYWWDNITCTSLEG